jgi:hypothetical protein
VQVTRLVLFGRIFLKGYLAEFGKTTRTSAMLCNIEYAAIMPWYTGEL